MKIIKDNQTVPLQICDKMHTLNKAVAEERWKRSGPILDLNFFYPQKIFSLGLTKLNIFKTR